MRYVLALDQGTTSSRAIVFDERGGARALAQKEFRQHFPQPGWVEHDALEILSTQLACARAALKKAKLAPTSVAAIGITNQRETTVVWDRRTGKPVHRAIVWQDSRTMLYDIHRGEWDEELLKIFGVPRAMLPEVLPSSQVYGTTAKTLLGAEIPIAGIAGDQQAALFGQACHEAGMAKNTYGT